VTHKVDHGIEVDPAAETELVPGSNQPGEPGVSGTVPIVEIDRVASNAEPALQVQPGRGRGVELGDEKGAGERFDCGAVLVDPGQNLAAEAEVLASQNPFRPPSRTSTRPSGAFWATAAIGSDIRMRSAVTPTKQNNRSG
jgi:hypothetical protein